MTCCISCEFSCLSEVIVWSQLEEFIFILDSVWLFWVTNCTQCTFYKNLTFITEVIFDNHVIHFILNSIQKDTPFDTFRVFFVLVTVFVLIVTWSTYVLLIGYIVSFFTKLKCVLTRFFQICCVRTN